MAGGRRGLLLVLALLAALAATPAGALIPAGSPFAASTAAAATPALTMTADARYTVDPVKRRVHVAVGLTALNHRHDTKTHRYYFDRAFLAVQPGTTAFKITSPDGKPTVRVERTTKTYTLLRIDFGKRLAAGATRRFRLTFDLVDPGGAPTRTTRIGTTLVSFAAWGLGTTDTPGGSVTVVFPAGFTIDVDNPEFAPPTTDAAGKHGVRHREPCQAARLLRVFRRRPARRLRRDRPERPDRRRHGRGHASCLARRSGLGKARREPPETGFARAGSRHRAALDTRPTPRRLRGAEPGCDGVRRALRPAGR